jgi:acetoacetyl-CoA synthetase
MSYGHDRAPLWTPTAETVQGARLTEFMTWAGARHGRAFSDYDELWRWSVDELEQFWGDIWEYCGVRASRAYEQVLSPSTMPGAGWFEGARLNYAENMLTRGRDPHATALLYASELHAPAELSWGELSEQVAAVAGGLRSLGVQRGDRVAAYMPNVPETLIAFLACASIGAIWSCAAPEFGARSVVDRFAQIEPKVLLVIDGYRHGGRDFDRTAALQTISAGLPSVAHTVMLPYLDSQASAAVLTGGLVWEELCARGEGAQPYFEQVPFDHPLWVLYSSGTTGLPKAIVHGHGAF